MESLKLYNYFRSSASFRLRIALNFKQLDFEYVPVHLVNEGGQQHSDEYKKLNPMSQVPTLVQGETVLTQSLPILIYLDEMNYGQPLLPKEPLKKAHVLSFCEAINSGIQPLQNLGALQQLETLFSANPEQKKQWMVFWIEKGFTAIEKIVASESGTYCFGDNFSAADVFLVPQVFAAERFGVDMAKFPKLKEISDRCLELDFVNKAHPANQPDTPA